jgi:hypothetical protein|tara:strand:+ start:8024 stop:8191 length:168 start_codon:yes stop_codon:yes gene_type:complete
MIINIMYSSACSEATASLEMQIKDNADLGALVKALSAIADDDAHFEDGKEDNESN